MPATNLPAASAFGPRRLKLGFLALTDASPLIVAQRQGFFARHGLSVTLHREVGWATIREKILYGELDAAQAPAPMLWATQLGVGSPACEVLTALVLNLQGNALTLSRALYTAGARDAASFRVVARERAAQRRPVTFGVVFPFSSHHLQLRDWLIAAGVQPERDVRIVVVPPAQMFRNLAAGTIDGYCSGEPWNTLAVRENVGWCPTWSGAQQPRHVEKVLMVTKRFTEKHAAEHRALIAAIVEACAWCDEPQHREALAQLLAESSHLNLPARLITPALIGPFDCGDGRSASAQDFHIFHRGEANVPTAEKAAEIQSSLVSGGLLAAGAVSAELPRQLFREDLFRSALTSHQLHDTSAK